MTELKIASLHFHGIMNDFWLLHMEGLDLNPDLLSKSGLSQVTQLTSVSSSVIGIIIAALKGLVSEATK